MNVTANVWTYCLMLGAMGLGGVLLGLVIAWTSWAQRWARLDMRAAALDQQAELLDIRSMYLPSSADTDSGFPAQPVAKVTPSDLPARGVPDEGLFDHEVANGYNDTGKRFPIAASMPEAFGWTPKQGGLVLVGGPVVIVSGEAPVIPAPLGQVDNAAWRRRGAALREWFGAWLLSLPLPVLTLVAAALAYWPGQPEAPRALNAPMAYVPPAPIVARATVPDHRTMAASHLIERLRTERGAPAPTDTPARLEGRHAVNAVAGTPTQRERSVADAQRYAIRAARATPTAARVFDTQEIVTPPEHWTAIRPVTAGHVSDAT